MALKKRLFAVCIFGTVLCSASAADKPNWSSARLWVWDINCLQQIKQKIRQQDPFFTAAFEILQKEGKQALTAGPFSVMNKTLVPPSGDKHDYMSLAPYFWPNPDTPDGLPYIRKDGQRNPQSLDSKRDRRQLGQLCDAVEVLSLCYYYTDDPMYAERAAMLVRTWFLDEATKMNPNLNFGQAVLGSSDGRCYGIIETAGFIGIVDSVGLIQNSPFWTAADQQKLVQWFTDYLTWLTSHPLGLEESQTKNNHSTWYDAQAAAFALFVGNRPLAQQILALASQKHIAAKIEPDGRQPHELTRTKSYGYSVMNLRGTFVLARLGEHVGMDLWNCRTEDERCLQKALDYLIFYADPKNKWPYQQIEPIDASALYPLLKQAHAKIRGFDAQPVLKTLSEQSIHSQRSALLFP
ncbi:MAG TPA: alginate lyase family protein [Anaerohalosphaeraceae bacterium]|nr:alginate lyase family protein [Anaerohalosphaeraceae bacterium]HOL32493.1 alginate lyase family protein [Anaerohalosphaeraceae bacterium]HOM76944.1 alginate lyase family protein [Anaerohalosphaeraceae bacterium]HPC65224.1 alginate lyase family protein [Anaerohalosphaeraceae bacterium]HPO70781.1 alginate lyase family protein [Anaerohalosphaeraceae bacterium]